MRFTWEEHFDVEDEEFEDMINNYLPYYNNIPLYKDDEDKARPFFEAVKEWYESNFDKGISRRIMRQIASELKKRYNNRKDK